MKITAAVVRERGGAFGSSSSTSRDPRADELLVEVAASGMCATDLHGRDGYYPEMPYPAVFGHEGAGVVRAVGRAVNEFKPGDHVVMSYPWCGACPNCRSTGRPIACIRLASEDERHAAPTAPRCIRRDGKPVYSAFFQQSSFGNLHHRQRALRGEGARTTRRSSCSGRSPAAARPAPAPCST